MREEYKKQNSELSEAELEGVSGGLSYPENLHDRARLICGDCKVQNPAKLSCPAGPGKLEQYMQKHGSISSITRCPFR